jgi:GNAT superfamily N-acetyltransferase
MPERYTSGPVASGAGTQGRCRRPEWSEPVCRVVGSGRPRRPERPELTIRCSTPTASRPPPGRIDTWTTSDPTDAAVLGLLAVAPAAQGRGLARALIRHVTDQLAELGHTRVVLHALLDNAAALHLYESEGWEAIGEPFEHSLLGRPMRTYERDLRAVTPG